MVQDERKQIFPECMVSFILVNNSISRGQLQYTDYLIYTNNSDDVNAETLQSSEKGHNDHHIVLTLLNLKYILLRNILVNSRDQYDVIY